VLRFEGSDDEIWPVTWNLAVFIWHGRIYLHICRIVTMLVVVLEEAGSSLLPGATSCRVTELPLSTVGETQGCSKIERNFQVITIFRKFKNAISVFSDAVCNPLSQN